MEASKAAGIILRKVPTENQSIKEYLIAKSGEAPRDVGGKSGLGVGSWSALHFECRSISAACVHYPCSSRVIHNVDCWCGVLRRKTIDAVWE